MQGAHIKMLIWLVNLHLLMFLILNCIKVKFKVQYLWEEIYGKIVYVIF